MMSAVIAVIVQWFFCYRICSLSKSWLLASLIAAVRICFSSTHIVLRHGHIVGNFSMACAHVDLVALYIWLIIHSHP
ncbi:hypothetical protein JB92DRAFT_2868956 [Gautieria morchelliformis]|nr:hypothetical protein JB92DRAFT_2868956 [Gautieria morchelliformis]